MSPRLRLLPAILLFMQAGAAMALEPVILQLNWRHQFQFAGYYAALEQGYYEQAGFDVTLKELDPDADPVNQVLGGRANYGVAASDLALHRAQGKPVVALATMIQYSPLVLVTRRDIATPENLRGKTLMLLPHETELYAMLKRAGIGADEFKVMPHSLDLQDMLKGRVDGSSAYLTDEPYVLSQAGITYRVFSPRSYGINFYGDTLFTSEAEIRRNAGRVERFRQASLRGWQYAMAHQEEMVDLILKKYNIGKSREHLLFEAREQTKLMLPDLIEIGHMSPVRWNDITATYTELGMLPKDSSIEGLIYVPDSTSLPAWLPELLATLVVFLLGCGAVATRVIVLNQRLQASEERYRFLVEHSADLIWEVGRDLNIRFVSQSDQMLRGYSAAEVIGQPLKNLVTPESYQRITARLENRLADEARGITTQAIVYEIELLRKDGTTLWAEINSSPIRDAHGRITGLHGICRDVSERRRNSEELSSVNQQLMGQLSEIQRLQHTLREQAIRDGLTGLFNRRYLDETLERELARATRDGQPLSLVLLDLDHFKLLNDSHGHAAGDEMLRQVGTLILDTSRAQDVACRFGGEELVVLMPGADEDMAAQRAEQWRTAVAGLRVRTLEGEAQITASFGVASFPEDGGSSRELLHAADLALYHAKHGGRNRVVAFRHLKQDRVT